MRSAPSPAVSATSPWLIGATALLALAVAMGIGRFAFTPLLPMMLHDGVITLSEGGWLATANYFGYFAGAASSMLIRVRPGRMVRFGLVATVLLTLGMGVVHTPLAWAVLRGLAGVASAWVLVFASGWCLMSLSERGRPELAAIMFCGPGAGIVLTGLAASVMVQAGWQAASGWLCFAAIALLIVVLIWPQFRSSRAPATATGSSAGVLSPRAWLLAWVYGLAGFGYIITATFLPVIARHALPGSPWPDLFWPMFGAGIVCGAALATRISTRHDPVVLLAIAYVLQAIAILAAIVSPSVPGFAFSSILLGMPFTVITLFAMREAHTLAGPSAPRLMGLMTATYGLGQIVGPPLATELVGRTGSFTPSLLVATTALLAGAALFMRMRRRD
ncbi:MAG TPA: YbfB/YjiJ family MFS transporter [Burkholderiaceae bacterium]|nr:YbfB/YjiJ family MFS transporter [Burkholderiaceae bacterium]